MMCKHTGKYISDELEQVKASILDILTTRKGARVLDREYGSDLFDFIDSSSSKMDYYRAIVEAITEYEPRLRLSETKLFTNDAGKLVVQISGDLNIDSGANKLVNYQMIMGE